MFRIRLKKIYLGIGATGIILLPSFPLLAASDLAEMWAEQSRVPALVILPIDTAQMGDFAVFFVHLAVVFSAFFALSMIYVGRVKMILAGKNEDNYDSAKHSFIVGIVSFFLSIAIYFSLDPIFNLINIWSERLA
jgi:hypothetical protein